MSLDQEDFRINEYTAKNVSQSNTQLEDCA